MARLKKTDELLSRFSDRYSAAGSDAGRIIERSVIGANVGANGYLTVAQADRLIAELKLSSASALLDIGSGRGWPGVYLAEQTGCSVVLTDVPVAGMKAAAGRVREADLSHRVHPCLASATNLPFVADSFDAISHSDTL
ncbi:MAG TPA: class I SAM-dependent methyltransferase [Dehalococcoidia bacterium]|nr:class I SAM-dependent methyltransferase [Dehalococcoidia bacterium]